MRISDWSSDVCSSDLDARRSGGGVAADEFAPLRRGHRHGGASQDRGVERGDIVAAEHGAVDREGRAADGAGAGGLKADRKSVVEGKGVSVRVDIGGRRILKKK